MLQNMTCSVKRDTESLGLFSTTRAGAISQTTCDKLHMGSQNINVSSRLNPQNVATTTTYGFTQTLRTVYYSSLISMLGFYRAGQLATADSGLSTLC